MLVCVYIVLGLLMRILFIFVTARMRYRMITGLTKLLSFAIRKILGIKLLIEGDKKCLKEKGNFIIANHLGYLDGIILSSLFPVIFVTKLQVKSWPVFGWMSQVGRTIFIDRSKKLKSRNFIEEICKVLKLKINILFFPECTSTDGTRILNFNPAYFQAPLNAGASILPITIQYTKVNSENVSLVNRDGVFWYGQVNFFQHLSEVLKQKNIEAKLLIHPKIEIGPYLGKEEGRKELSEFSRRVISEDFIFVK